MIDSDKIMISKMNALKQKYLLRLEPQTISLRSFIDACKTNRANRSHKEEIGDIAHKLKGSGATYGYAAISDAARELEDALLSDVKLTGEQLAGKAKLLLEACLNARASIHSLEPLKTEPPSNGAGPGHDRIMILIVDDDASTRAMIQLLFESDADVVLAHDGQEALEFLKNISPDIILLDDKMPNISGMQFLQLLHDNPPKKKIAIAMVTANKTQGDILRADKLGIIDYIMKPFNPTLLRKRMLSYLSHIRQKVLIADDDPSIRDLFESKFSDMGFTVLLAENGEKAYDLAVSEKPNLIILDRRLPGVDGLFVFQKLKENTKVRDIPVLFLTAKRQETDVIEAMQQGAKDYVIKPFKIDEVMTRCLDLIMCPIN